MKEIETKSRKVFAGHHVTEQKNEQLYKRKFDRISEEYLGLPKGWFKGKLVLDACCGTCLSNTHKLLELGAQVVAFDLPSDEPFDESRIKEKFEGKYSLMRANVLDLQEFSDNKFDYVHCEGALHHTTDAAQGFKELARVTKPDGHLYVSVFGTSGIFRICEDALRKEYQTNEHGLNLKEWVDGLDSKMLAEIKLWFLQNSKSDDHLRWLSSDWMFDEDFIVTIKDRLQAPIYTRHSDEEIGKWYEDAGFKAHRITRYPTGCNNIRRLMNPVYENYDAPISRLLNGNGFPQWIGQKIKS